MTFGPSTIITGYLVTAQPSGPPVVDVYAQTTAATPTRFTWHLDPVDMGAVLTDAATAIREAVDPPDLVLLMQSAMKTALSDMLVTKGLWGATTP